MTERPKRKQAKAWMILHDIRSVDIQDALKMKHHTQVVETLSGKRDDRQVLRYLLEQGCPAEYLDLPDDIKVAA